MLDSRAGGGDAGRLPDRRHGRRRAAASSRRRRSSASRRRAGGSRPRGGSCWSSASRPGSTSRAACTSSSPTIAELVELAARHGVELRDLRKPPPGLNVPTGANLDARREVVLTVGSDCAIGKMTVALELDAEARRRGVAQRVRPDRPDRDRDRGLGDLGRRGRRRLRRRRRRAARARGGRARRRGALGRGPGLAAPSGVLGRHARADARQRAARVRALPPRRAGVRRRQRALPDAVARELVELHERDRAPRPAGKGRGGRAQHPRRSTRRRRGRRSPPPRPRPGSPPTTRFAFGPSRLGEAVLAALGPA